MVKTLGTPSARPERGLRKAARVAANRQPWVPPTPWTNTHVTSPSIDRRFCPVPACLLACLLACLYYPDGKLEMNRIWRTSHRYREWLSLKERLRADFGARNLPDEKIFPQKEDVGALVTKLLTSCQGCREGGFRPVGVSEERRRGLQTYFSMILDQKRGIWDSSADIKAFFFPGPPTSYSAALSRRRSEKLKEEKLKAKEAASATSMMASSLKSTLGSLFEASPLSAAASTSSPFPLSSTSSSTSRAENDARRPSSASASASTPAAAGMGGVLPPPSPVPPSPSVTSSMLDRFSAITNQMPSLRDLLFDDAPPSRSAAGSRASSRHGGTSEGGGGVSGAGTSRNGSIGGSRDNKLPSWTQKPPSESGVTDPDGGISENGGSHHSCTVRE